MKTALVFACTTAVVWCVLRLIKRNPDVIRGREKRAEQFVQNKVRQAEKWLATEVTTFHFTCSILIVGFVLAIGFSFVDNSKSMKDSSAFVEYVVTFLNFIGVMLISRGVILMSKERTELAKAANDPSDPAHFSGVVTGLFVEASSACERGSLLVAAAFLLDVAAKSLG